MNSGQGMHLRTIMTTALMACAVFASEAAAVERVQDGGFDGASCVASSATTIGNCTSAVWDEDSNASVEVNPIGPLCSGVILACSTGGSGFTSPPNWARLGASTSPGAGSRIVETAVEQMVTIPAAPATLTFYFRFLDLEVGGLSAMRVRIDGTQILELVQPTGFATYMPVTLDVSAFAGGVRALRFEGVGLFSASDSDSYDIDRVSLDAPDATPPATGQRAAALKKCKKKKSAKARKKCKRRAAKLPA